MVCLFRHYGYHAITTTRLKSSGISYQMAGAPGPVMQEAAFDRGDAAHRVAAAPMAGGPQRPQKPIEIRKEFPETWLFDNLEFGEK
jgi:hypothetical protein